MKIFFIIVTLMMLSISNVLAQVTTQDFFKERKEIVVSFDLPDIDVKEINKLSSCISIDKIDAGRVFAYINKNQFAEFLTFDIDFDVETPPSMLHIPVMRDVDELKAVNDWDFYPTYDAYIAMMNQFAADYPDLCEVVNAGVTNEGRDILFAHINSTLGFESGEPQFMYTSSMHGDELTGYILTLRLIDYLLSNYGTDPRITNMVEQIDIWINPLANPDGTFAGGNETVYGATRGNALGIDFNRNFPDPEDGPHPDGNAYQKETIVFMTFAEENDFVMSTNFHGGAEVCNYPWDTWPRLHPDDDWWQYVCREYVDTVHLYSPANYLDDFNDGITNGYAWYSISGGRQDYMNYFHNCREFTLEISMQKLPPATQMPAFWEYNYRSMLNYIEQSLYGFQGIVTDKLSGEPIEAKVEVVGHDFDNSWVYSHLPTGKYHRPIKAGNYSLVFSAEGYHSKTISSLIIQDEQVLNVNVQLEPITVLSADFIASSTLIPVGTAVNFFSESVGGDVVLWNWAFEGGIPQSSVLEDPSGIVYNSKGEYEVSLFVRDSDGNTDEEIKTGYVHVLDAYIMGNQTITTCNSLFYDSGGELENYANNEDYYFTIFPENDDDVAVIDFIEFNVEFEGSCNYDYLEIFDGENQQSPFLGKWCGTTSPGKVYATSESGALTVHFFSDNSEVRTGWKAVISCDSNVGITETALAGFNVFPNPASDLITVQGEDTSPVNIVLKNLIGEELYTGSLYNGICQIPVHQYSDGVYLVVIKTLHSTSVRKIILK